MRRFLRRAALFVADLLLIPALLFGLPAMWLREWGAE